MKFLESHSERKKQKIKIVFFLMERQIFRKYYKNNCPNQFFSTFCFYVMLGFFFSQGLLLQVQANH